MRINCTQDPSAGVTAAVAAIRGGDLIVLPTDTVYGLAADAFNPDAVSKLLATKTRTRAMPPPVLVADAAAVDALAADLPNWTRRMLDALWPGALTIVCRAQPSLTWDLGDTKGTVAIRVPDHEVARQTLRATGPLAVSSANISGLPAALTVDEASDMLGDAVEVYLDAGPSTLGKASTIIDLTSPEPRVLRHGAIGLERIHEFNNTIEPGPHA